MNSENKRIRAIVSGRVQGVGFRISTLQKARQIGVRGYVRNLKNRNVEIVALGQAEKVDKLLQWARLGPPSAIVNSLEVEVITDNDEEEFPDFEIRR